MSALCSKERHQLYLPRLFSAQTSLRRYSRTKADSAKTCGNMRDLRRIASQQEISHILLKNLRNHVNHVQYFLTRKKFKLVF